MKSSLFIIVVLFNFSVLYCSAKSVSVEEPKNGQWTMIPDGNGKMRFISLTDVYENVPENRFVPDDDVIFIVHNQGNIGGTVVPLGDAAQLAASGFNPAHPTRFTVHGWQSDYTAQVNTDGISSHMEYGQFNIIVVDWGAGALTANYITARNRVDGVGELVGRYINWLNTQGVPSNDIYLIGHSLGGHVVGMAGKNTNQLVNTIVSLDPAGPLFSLDDPDRRVDAADAQQVDIIHSNGNILGFGPPIGHADFYPNGGNSQPGCGTDITGICAHVRAMLFWVESINNNNFWSTQCASWDEINNGQCTPSGPSVPLGGQPSNFVRTARGVYFLETADSSPFALGPR